jgi:hypothetical protein
MHLGNEHFLENSRRIKSKPAFSGKGAPQFAGGGESPVVYGATLILNQIIILLAKIFNLSIAYGKNILYA